MQSNISTNDTSQTPKRARRKTHDTLPSNNKDLSGGVTMATLPAMHTTGFVRLPQVLQPLPHQQKRLVGRLQIRPLPQAGQAGATYNSLES